MKNYRITENSAETIEFKSLDDKYALVHKSTASLWEVKTIILNKRELLTLYQAIQEEILEGVK